MAISHKDLLETARKRFALAKSEEEEIRREAKKDLAFLAGEQWDARTKHERERAGRPALVINKLPTFVQQVVNDARSNKPAIKVSPKESGVNTDTRDVVQGLIRHIEYDSDADVAYNTAEEYAVSCGFGYYRLVTEYCEERSFDQEIKIKRIADPFTVYFDPAAKEVDRSDADWCFVVESYSKDEFAARWPKAEASSSNFFAGASDEDGWFTEDQVRVAEYWYVEMEPRTLVLLSTGETAFDDELPEELPEGVEALKEREVTVRTVKCAVINGQEVLEENDWPGQWIPIVPVWGKELMVDGKRKLFSLIRWQRDPQQLFNYYKTAMAETVGLSPKAPWIGVEGQFAGHEAEWQTANLALHPYLEYKPVSLNGQPAPPPQRQVYEPPIQALSVGAMQASDDMKATAGIFDASLGAQGNETSGIAIARRQRESDVANFHFLDNLARAQRHTGRMLIDLIPKIYDTEREIRILGEDMKEKVVRVNRHYVDEAGRERYYDLGIAKYDVTVSTGPSYTTARQEAFDMLTQFAQAYPALLQMAGDIVFRNSDIPGADQLAERFQKMLPPQLQPQSDQAIPPQAQAMMAEQQQLIQQLGDALKGVNETIRTKQMELLSRERIETMRIQADLIKTEAQINSKEAQAMLQAEMQAIQQKLDQLHEAEMMDTEHEQQRRTQQADQAHQFGMQAVAAGQEQDMAALNQQFNPELMPNENGQALPAT